MTKNVLHQTATGGTLVYEETSDEYSKWLEKTSLEVGITYSREQRKALRAALSQRAKSE